MIASLKFFKSFWFAFFLVPLLAHVNLCNAESFGFNAENSSHSSSLRNSPPPAEFLKPQTQECPSSSSLCNIFYGDREDFFLERMFKNFSGYLLKICVFQLGEYRHGNFFTRYLVRLIKRRYEMEGKTFSLNPASLERDVAMLEELGGIRRTKKSIDGLAEIDYMLLTYDNVLDRIVQKGGKWVKITAEPTSDPSHYKSASNSSLFLHIIFAETETPEWKTFFKDVLSKMQWEQATVEFSDKTRDVFITRRLYEKEAGESRACFLRCHPPGQTYAMENKYVGIHLGAKKDLCLFDYRGTHKSTGTPSEGGYYLDAETIFQELLRTYAYKPEEIWVTGFCLGGAVAAYIKTKYHDLGVCYVGENTFASLIDVVKHQPWPISYMGTISFDAIKSTRAAITSRIEQDGFDTVRKFDEVKSKKKGICIFVNTFGDRILPADSGKLLFAAASKNNTVFDLSHYNPKARRPHAEMVFDEGSLLSEYLKIISSH